MRKYVAETIATFFLIFCGCGAMVINTEFVGAITHTGVAAAWGLIVTIMIFAYGRISGAHMNPAVTIALTLVKLHPKKEVVPYLVAQLIGAFAASLTLAQLFPDNETSWLFFTARFGNTILYLGIHFNLHANDCNLIDFTGREIGAILRACSDWSNRRIGSTIRRTSFQREHESI